MNPQPKVSFTYTLSIEDFKDAIIDYVQRQGGVMGDGHKVITFMDGNIPVTSYFDRVEVTIHEKSKE